MFKVKLSGTELVVSRLSFGTSRLHHIRSSRAREMLLEEAYDTGFSHFDTSPYYGYGVSEVSIGRFLSRRDSGLTIATKVGLYSPLGMASNYPQIYWRKGLGKIFPRYSKPQIDWTVSRAEKSLDASLKNLNRNCIDMLLLHEPDPELVHKDEFVRWLENQVSKGKIRYWGLAGDKALVSKWLKSEIQRVPILQVRDDPNSSFEISGTPKRVPQITFGYMSAHRSQLNDDTVSVLLKDALLRNRSGTVLVSTTKRNRISAFARIADESTKSHSA